MVNTKTKTHNTTAYLMLLPILVLLTIFVFIPFVYSIVVSFYKWSFYRPSVFVGWHNYYLVLTDPKFYKSVIVGVKFTLYVIPAQIVFSFLLAHVIRNLGRRSAGFVKSAIYIPTVISGVIASIVFTLIYNFDGGFANFVMTSLGFDKVGWLVDVKTALPAISVPAIWLGLGVSSLIMLAGLLDVPESYYEAAELDGANSLRKMLHITIPMMKNVILFIIVTGVVAAMQQFELPWLMTAGGPLDSTTTPNVYIFNHFQNDNYLGQTIASALLLFVVLGSVSATIFKVLNSEKLIDG